MTAPRSFARSAAVLGAATALTLAGAGAASAATTSHQVNNETNTVSVTFKQDHILDPSLCAAAVVPTSSAATIVAQLEAASNLDLDAIIALLSGDTPATFLRTGGLIPVSVVSLIDGDKTVSATVEPNVYSLIAKCTGDDVYLQPTVLVGDPASAIQGSLGALSSDGDALGTLSSAMGGGN